MFALKTIDLQVRYRAGRGNADRLAVDRLSFSVNPGEVVGFIGPNGAGKSSTIKALMGFVSASGGRAELLGQPAGSLEARRKVGFLPEVALYYPWLTPRETLWLYGRLSGLTADETRRQSPELLQRVGLAGRENERLKTFSKGMLQRVGIAQALLGKPELLILDEVSSGLDPLGRRDLRNLLLEQKKQGVTIFFSSHELTEVAQLCDRVVLVNRGCVVEERSVPDLQCELRRYWLRVRCSDPPPFPAKPEAGSWYAEFSNSADWRCALGSCTRHGAELEDAGEREGSLEEYFVAKVA
jgi:ABC-2 type transport system ATP-binding protein